jgi:hypothetical protein
MMQTPKPSPDESVEPPRPPNTPRPITPAVRRRSWMEPRVRFWAIGFLAVVGIAIWFFASQYQEYLHEQRLIETGVTVAATVQTVNNLTPIAGQRYILPAEVDMKFMLNGQAQDVTGTITRLPGDAYVIVGGTITLRVNPDHPEEWTERTEPEALSQRLLAAGVVLILGIMAAALATILLRRRAISTWRDGIAEAFAVIDTYHTALAPRSHAVHCAATSGRDQQVITVYLPARLPRPKPGELLWLIHPPKKPRASIAAAAYEG